MGGSAPAWVAGDWTPGGRAAVMERAHETVRDSRGAWYVPTWAHTLVAYTSWWGIWLRFVASGYVCGSAAVVALVSVFQLSPVGVLLGLFVADVAWQRLKELEMDHLAWCWKHQPRFFGIEWLRRRARARAAAEKLEGLR